MHPMTHEQLVHALWLHWRRAMHLQTHAWEACSPFYQQYLAHIVAERWNRFEQERWRPLHEAFKRFAA